FINESGTIPQELKDKLQNITTSSGTPNEAYDKLELAKVEWNRAKQNYKEAISEEEVAKSNAELARLATSETVLNNVNNSSPSIVFADRNYKIACADQADSEYKVKQSEVKIAKARVKIALAKYELIIVQNDPQLKSRAEQELVSAQQEQVDVINVVKTAKLDLNNKNRILETAEANLKKIREANVINKKIQDDWLKPGSKIKPTIIKTGNSNISPPELLDEIAEELGKKFLENEGEQKSTEGKNISNFDDNTEKRLQVRAEFDQWVRKAKIAAAHFRRWNKKQSLLAGNEDQSLELRNRTGSTASVDSIASIESACAFCETTDDVLEGENETNLSTDQQRERLLNAQTQAQTKRDDALKAWKELLPNGVPTGEFANNSTEIEIYWAKKDSEIVKERAEQQRTIQMKEYCAAHAERWIAQAAREKAQQNVNRAANCGDNLEDVRRHEEEAKKLYFKLIEDALEEPEIMQQLDSTTIKELEKRDKIFYHLWVAIVKRLEEASSKEDLPKKRKEIDPMVYFKEVDDRKNLSREAIATTNYANAIKQESLEQALEAVLEGRVSSAKTLWHTKLVASVTEARKTERERQQSPQSDWKLDESRRMAQRNLAIAKANKKGFETFHEAVDLLSGIKSIWGNRLKEAAKAYVEGEQVYWDALTEEERQAYNATVKIENKKRQHQEQEKIDNAERLVQEALVKTNGIFIFSSKKPALEAVAEAERSLAQLQTTQEARKKTIEEGKYWITLTPQARELERAIRIQIKAHGNRRKTITVIKDKEKSAYNSSEEQLEEAAIALKKAKEAQEKGQNDLADLWRQNAKHHQVLSVNYEKQVEEILVNKIEESSYWNEITEDDGENISKNEEESFLWEETTEINRSTASKLKEAAEVLEKAREAQEKSQNYLADLWKQNAKHNQLSAANYEKQMEAILAYNKKDILYEFAKDNWDKVSEANESGVSRLKEAFKALEKATEAQDKGQNDLADLWRQSTKHYQILATNYEKYAEGILSDNGLKSIWNKVSEANESGASRLKEATEALEKAREAQGKDQNDLADLWKQSAKQYQVLAANYEKQVAAILINNKEESILEEQLTKFSAQFSVQFDCYRASEINETGASRLEEATEALEKSREAQDKGQNDQANLWRQSAKHYQISASNYSKYAEAILINDAEEGTDWDQAS
ncbi:MAG TPA: hypothetical protein VJK54_00410, partial [Chthoniobacterales bacterium]|nr:hypothetical protein [Chthoniobacterales bacterium]